MPNDISSKLAQVEKAWNDKDITTWINVKDELGFYSKDLGRECPEFLKDMSLWNHRYTHEETGAKHYKNWNPYCCSDKPCKSTTMDRMLETDYGWECEFCKTKIGKHLYRIDVDIYNQTKSKELWYYNGGILLKEHKG